MVATTFANKGQSIQRGKGCGTSSGQLRSSTAPASAPSAPVSYDEYRDMPCFAHRDASGKCNHTNRNYKFFNDIKADQEAGYKRNWRQRPRGKGKADKDKESKDGSDMDEDPAPKPAEKAEGEAGFIKEVIHTIAKEISKLLKAGFIKEVIHTKWVANPVLVPKKNTKVLRMCVDYTSLNKACPKDPFPLPRIDQVIDSTAGSELLFFLDAYSGYHQIKMKQSDQLATSFVTPYGTYCYVTIPFGLKNAGATYQRTMQKCLADQIGRNIHAYVDDIAVMSKKQDGLIADLQETFDNLRKYNMMLNPTKCVFGVLAGQLLGFIVSHRGIEVNPEKIRAILNISRPNDLKDVQRLTGCVAAVSRFISRLGEKALPLYKLMKKLDEFVWTDKADAALKDLKRVLSTAPVLAAPEDQEPMLLYMVATNKVVSIVIVVERKEEAQEYDIQ
jgi:hypothetical protein